MSRLLLDDKPLMVLPTLAERVGLNESIILQQLHYWLLESSHQRNGDKWIYNTYDDWKKQFSFWSDKTIRRTITKLKNDGLIITGNYNKKKFDKTNWYRIDYKKLESLMTRRCGQNDQTMWSDCPDASGQNDHTNTRDYSEITTENELLIEAHARIGESDGLPSTGQNGDDLQNEAKISHTPDQIAAALENRYIELKGKGLFISAKDLQDIEEIAKSDIALDDSITWLEDAFTNFKPKYSGDRISNFAYCKKCILHSAYLKKAKEEAKKNAKGIDFSKPAFQNNKYQKRPIRQEIIPDWLKEQKESATSETDHPKDEMEKQKFADLLKQFEDKE